MALDRLIAEVMLLIGSIYLGYALFIVLSHMGLALSLVNSINQMASTSIYIPDAVIVTNETTNQLYLVIYNNGHTPINLGKIYMNCQGNTMEISMNNTYLAPPGNYIIINRQIPYQQCIINTEFCIANTTICMIYKTNTTQYVIPPQP
ncbi:hypothetical protein [Vulcanisaeta distributa]|uniref:hypothetical protein n=1 Tax=Vulcanisaeta distributa TaxID=164451 RepID=UPI0006CF2B87|nr:hypothetical protein [Vulcanisaeta distributa]